MKPFSIALLQLFQDALGFRCSVLLDFGLTVPSKVTDFELPEISL